MKNLINRTISIVLCFLTVSVADAQSSMNSRSGHSWQATVVPRPTVEPVTIANPPGAPLPLISSDSIGDGGLVVDIKEFRGGTSGGLLTLRIVLATPLNPANFGGYIGLDVDQNSHTGPAMSFAKAGQDVGCEYTVYLFAFSGGTVSYYDSLGVLAGTVPVVSDSNSLTLSIPLSALHDTDGKIDVAAVVGTLLKETDWVPETGHGTAKQYVGSPHLVVPDTIKFAKTRAVGTPDTLTVGLQNNGGGNIVVSSISLDLPEFSVVGSTSFTIEGFSAKDLRIRFNPSSPGTKNATLTIASNDSLSPTHSHLVIKADYAPNIVVKPDSFVVTLNEGDSTASPMTIINTGLGTLDWSADGRSVSEQMTLTLPRAEVTTPFTEQRQSAALRSVGIVRQGNVGAVAATLSNLSGKHIGFTNSANYAVLSSDLLSRGAVVTSVFSPILSSTLVNLDLLVIDDFAYNLTSTEIDLVRNWVQSGKGLLVQGDDYESMPMINALIAGTGISDVSFGTYFDAILTDIVPHQITGGVDSVNAAAYGGHMTLTGPALPLVYDTASHVHIAVSHLGSGRVLVAGNEVCGDFSFVLGDARLLSNQAIDWLVTGKNLLVTNPASGTVAPGDSQHVTVGASAKNLSPGDFSYTVEVSSNDPVNSVKIIPLKLHVVGAPNLVVPDSFNTNRTTFVGVADTFAVLMKNTGSEHLVVLNITSNNPEFSVLGSTLFAVPSLTSKNLPIRFNPGSPGVKSATITITSNDPDSTTLVKIVGTAAHPPKIAVQPDSFSVALNAGDSSSVLMTIDNSAGLGPLTFRVSDREESVLSTSAASSQGYTVGRLREKKNELSKLLKTFSENAAAYRATDMEAGYMSHSIVTTSTLPLLVKDPIGDAGGGADIAEIHGSTAGGKLQMSFIFSPSTKPDSALGILALDIDQRSTTGRLDTATYHDIGSEYYVYFYRPLFGDSVDVVDSFFNILGRYPLIIQNQEFSFSVPLSMLGGDDGRMNFVAVSGNINVATDWAPDKGHALILPDAAWLSSAPDSGQVPPGGSTQVSLKVKTKDMFGGKYKASVIVTSNDPLKPVITKPFALTLTGIPKISLSADSLNFGQVFNGYKKRLDLVITNTGTDVLKGSIQLQDSVFVALDSTFSVAPTMSASVRIEFRPRGSGHRTKSFTVLSNTSTSSLSVKLSGDAIAAPNIKTNVTSFTKSMKGSDTVKASFKIFNTGEAPLTVKVSDEAGSGSGSAGAVIYATSGSSIYVIDLKTKAIITTIPSPIASQGPTGLAYSGKELFIEDGYSASFIYVLNPATGAVLRSFPVPTSSVDGLAYVNDKLYVMGYITNTIYVMNPQTGALLDSMFAPVSITGGMDGANGRLFVTGVLNQMLYELNPSNASVIKAYYVGQYFYGVAFTGTRLFASSTTTGNVVEFNPETGAMIDSFYIGLSYALAGGGPGEAPWLSETPVNPTVAGKDSVSVQFTIVPKGLAIGQYKGSIVIESNDPDSARAVIAVTIDVTSGVAREDGILPTEFALYQNYPNPFNPTTMISYDLPKQAHVSLKVYNILGQEVAVVVDGVQQAGRYRERWGQNGVASGIYFYLLRTEEFTQTRKMMLLK